MTKGRAARYAVSNKDYVNKMRRLRYKNNAARYNYLRRLRYKENAARYNKMRRMKYKEIKDEKQKQLLKESRANNKVKGSRGWDNKGS